MRDIAIAIFLLLGLLAPREASAQFNGCSVGFCPSFFGGGGAGTSCSQSTTYLAAVTGLSNAEQNAYNVAICGMVFDGDFAGLDGLYIYANASAANATVNAKAPGTHNITTHGTCTFTVDRGFTGDSNTCYQDPGFIPSTNGGNYTALHAVMGTCILSTPGASGSWMGGGATYIFYNTSYAINNIGITATNPTAIGSWILQGTGSSESSGTASLYYNGLSIPSAEFVY